MKRRSFLKHAFHSMAVPGVVGSMGFTSPGIRSMQELLREAADTDKVLVMIFLEGGNDGLNTVIPLDSMSGLNAVRNRVVLNESDILNVPDANVGFHKKMSDLLRLYEEDRFQVIQNVGYDDQNFSHFRSTDIWMSGSDSKQVLASGWVGRQLKYEYPTFPDEYPNDELKDPLAVEIGYGSSLLFQGQTGSMSMTISSVDSFYELVDNVEQEAPDTPAGDKLKYLRLIAKQSQEYGQRVVEVADRVKSHVPYPTNNYLADQLKIVSKLIGGESRTPLYLVRLGGFDTHDTQVAASDHSEGWHADLLKMLNDAIYAFQRDLDFHNVSDKVLGMTFSEFGRTIVSNASNGTDHGAAAPMFFFGNKVKGGVVGKNPLVTPTMDYNSILPHEYDFRQLYGSVLEQWFGLDLGARNEILLGEFDTVEIIGEKATALSANEPSSEIMIYPNPVKDMATLRFSGTGETITVDLYGMDGRKMRTIYRGSSRDGLNEIPINLTGLSGGHYLLTLGSASYRKTLNLLKH